MNKKLFILISSILISTLYILHFNTTPPEPVLVDSIGFAYGYDINLPSQLDISVEEPYDWKKDPDDRLIAFALLGGTIVATCAVLVTQMWLNPSTYV